jgi:hypothetical protein
MKTGLSLSVAVRWMTAGLMYAEGTIGAMTAPSADRRGATLMGLVRRISSHRASSKTMHEGSSRRSASSSPRA